MMLRPFGAKLFFCACVLTLVGGTPLFAQIVTDPIERARLEEELRTIERDIAEQSKKLDAKRKESASIQRDVDILNAQIKKTQLEIQAKNIAINRLAKDITTRNVTIKTLEEEITDRRETIAELLQDSYEVESASLPEVVLGSENLSDFFVAIDSLSTVQDELQSSIVALRGTKKKVEVEKSTLETKKVEETSVKQEIEIKKQGIEKNEQQKQVLLTVSKGQERSYEQVLAERRARAAKIRAALFELRDSAAIPFGKAYEYALAAEKRTGVRPAFLLAILTQETNLGANVGTCNRPGDPPNKHWTQIMKPERDIEPFKRITSALRLDPEGLPLSCPYGSGWGGAMGPAQFIPSTWERIQDRVGTATGHRPPNPWEPEDAFTASALYLADLGAARRTFAAEREAALRYYAGGNWSKPSNAFYGNSVMQIAANIQTTMIDPLQGL